MLRSAASQVFYTGFRIICASQELTAALSGGQRLLAGLSLGGIAWASRIPVIKVLLAAACDTSRRCTAGSELALQVPQEAKADVGACLGTLYGDIDKNHQIEYWAEHMHVSHLLVARELCSERGAQSSSLQELGVHHFHTYKSIGDVVASSEDRLNTWQPVAGTPRQPIAGMEWVHLVTYPIRYRYGALISSQGHTAAPSGKRQSGAVAAGTCCRQGADSCSAAGG